MSDQIDSEVFGCDLVGVAGGLRGDGNGDILGGVYRAGCANARPEKRIGVSSGWLIPDLRVGRAVVAYMDVPGRCAGTCRGVDHHRTGAEGEAVGRAGAASGVLECGLDPDFVAGTERACRKYERKQRDWSSVNGGDWGLNPLLEEKCRHDRLRVLEDSTSLLASLRRIAEYRRAAGRLHEASDATALRLLLRSRN